MDHKELPPGHDVSAHKDTVGQEMHRFKRGELHSGTGKKGKLGKIVKDRAQAIAISLSVAGKSKGKSSTSDHAERLISMGFSEETANEVAAMLDFATSNLDWGKQFDDGKGPGTTKQPESGPSDRHHPEEIVPKKTRKNNPKQDQPEMLSGVALPKGPGNPMSGSSKDVQGMRMLG